MKMNNMILSQISKFGIPVVGALKSTKFDDVSDLLSFVRPLVGLEGFVISFGNARLKVKAEQYVRIHKFLDVIRYNRNTVEAAINGELDDVLPLLDEAAQASVNDTIAEFFALKSKKLAYLENLVKDTIAVYGNNRKDIALNVIPKIHKTDARFIFSALDGKDISSVLDNHVKNSLSNNKNYDNLMDWFNS
jgi:hypothetical protein